MTQSKNIYFYIYANALSGNEFDTPALDALEPPPSSSIFKNNVHACNIMYIVTHKHTQFLISFSWIPQKSNLKN